MLRRPKSTRRLTSLRELRERRELTQVELAVKAGCSLNTVGAAERHGIVSRESAEKIARALGCRLDDVLMRMGRPRHE